MALAVAEAGLEVLGAGDMAQYLVDHQDDIIDVGKNFMQNYGQDLMKIFGQELLENDGQSLGIMDAGTMEASLIELPNNVPPSPLLPQRRRRTDAELEEMFERIRKRYRQRRLSLQDIGLPTDSFGKFPLNMYYRKRYGGYKRSKRYKKRRKLVTKRGVKSIIKRDQAFSNWTRVRWNNGFYVGSTYNLMGLAVYSTFASGSFISTGDFVKAINATNPATPAVGGNDQPQSDTSTFHMRRVKHALLIHSASNELQMVDIWHIINKDTTSTDPLNFWEATWHDYLPLTSAGAPVYFNETNTPLEADFQTYPTMYKEWNKNFKIMKKVSFVLKPGQTVKWNLKGRGVSYFRYTENAGNYPAPLSQHIMFRTRGVPTHQNDGTAMGNDTGEVGRSSTGIDVTIESSAEVARSAQPYPLYLAKSSYGTVTDARTITSAAAQAIAANI